MGYGFKVRYNPQIYLEMQKTIDHYRRETGNNELGKRFVKTVKKELKKLNKTALLYQVRYDNIRFLPINPFSIMAHYWIDEENKFVSVEAIIHTSENPDTWKGRTIPK